MIVRFLTQNFYLIQVGIGAVFLFIAWIVFRPNRLESNFRVRESDRNLKFNKNDSSFADAKLKQDPLQLTGIQTEGPPHIVLGIKASSNPEEIQRAYRELMKRYHPDKVGRPGTREWQDAQKIAEAINRAKNEMMKLNKS